MRLLLLKGGDPVSVGRFGDDCLPCAYAGGPLPPAYIFSHEAGSLYVLSVLPHSDYMFAVCFIKNGTSWRWPLGGKTRPPLQKEELLPEVFRFRRDT